MNFPRSCVISDLFSLTLTALLAVSCATTSSNSLPVNTQKQDTEKQPFTMIFAGDIMAHTINYKAGNFPAIWSDVKPLIKQGNLSFANLEAPVNDKADWSSYPQFNMHSSYVQAATEAGFNVFSLANNHTNDWFLEGINSTRSYFEKRKDVWACGVRAKNDGKLTYRIIKKDGWTVLFAAVTEILNRNDYSGYIDYFPSKKHENLIKQLKEISASSTHDIFVLSVHTDEEEYKTAVTESHRQFFRRLAAECGVDIIWANHPHCSKVFEKISINENKEAFIMYANGNTISGQRTSPSLFKNPNERDDTGDGLIIKVQIEKNESGNGFSFSTIEPHFITTYIKPDGQMVIRLVDDDLIHSLNRAGIPSWASYLERRRTIYENLKGNSKWQ